MQDPISPRSIRPLYDVWLKPRRVFRELGDTPVGALDYALGGIQGAVSWLALSRAQSAGLHEGVAATLGKALVIGPLAGLAGIFLMTAIYARIGRRAGGAATRNQVFHVLAYSGVPMLVSLVLWFLTALVVGTATFVDKAPADLDGFQALLLMLQNGAHLFLIAWSLILQIMGFSEVAELATRRTFAVWVAGQLLVLAGLVILAMLAFALGQGTPP